MLKKYISKVSPVSIALLVGTLQVVADLTVAPCPFPIMHYGMYSAPAKREESYQTYEIVANGNKLEGLDYRIHVWENILAPIYAYERIAETNDFEKDKGYVKKGLELARLGFLTEAMEKKMTNENYDQQTFGPYYKQYLQNILGKPIQTLEVFRSFYGYSQGQYHLVNRVLIVNQ